MSTAIEDAISHFGSEQKLATAIGISQPSVNKMKRRNRVSAELAVKIDAATGGLVPKTRLRPDLWPADHGAAA